MLPLQIRTQCSQGQKAAANSYVNLCFVIDDATDPRTSKLLLLLLLVGLLLECARSPASVPAKWRLPAVMRVWDGGMRCRGLLRPGPPLCQCVFQRPGAHLQISRVGLRTPI
jgi:hypothetical protein